MKNGLLALLFCFASGLMAADFQEGKNYEVLKDPHPGPEPELVEFFSFLCPHCYAFEGIINQVEAELPQGVHFDKVHIEPFGGEQGKLMARAWAIMSVMGVEKQVAPKIFEGRHRYKIQYRDLRDIRAAFVAAGVKGEEFDAASRSFPVESRLAQMRAKVEELQPRSIPDLVVNGKYRIDRASVPDAKQLEALVEYLLNKK
ncbi:DsbA family protein [Gallaecimonas kandeliae]|uniref:DsbA family protein n=1 Tax=Gallaecimonas kandeliae TaxID=3029055 RepID=UPI00264946AF|nr:DsbA family protein [Gallaecimonas kandeliae]WKE65617.1 DsbA family protein [Gallaecimonas kandeliae]